MKTIKYLKLLTKEHDEERLAVIERLKEENVNTPKIVKRNGELWIIGDDVYRITERNKKSVALVNIFVKSHTTTFDISYLCEKGVKVE